MHKTAESSWNNCLSFIKDNIQPQAYKTWFEPIKPLKLSDNALSIQVPSKFFLRVAGRTLHKTFKNCFDKRIGRIGPSCLCD